MVLIITQKAIPAEIKKMSHEYGNYIKVVVDIEKGILAGGSAYHYEEEQELLEYGSLEIRQEFDLIVKNLMSI